MVMSINKERHHSGLLLVWYIAFGALHELAHLCAAVALGFGEGILDDGYAAFAYRILLGRHCIVPDMDNELYYHSLVRHAGWIFSLALAIVFFYFTTTSQSPARLPAFLTALEAISTDLLGLSSFLPLLVGNSSHSDETVFRCGNFGVILLHHLWMTDQGKNALNCLEQMVNVTMMRGAQSGGVVSFQPNNGRGIRSRVLNKKRTDLSKEILKRVRKDFRPATFPKDFVPTLVGHTRFATSSASTLDGTHPHQWTPASRRRVYQFSIPRVGIYVPDVRVTQVENFITHNGDFDFYQINGATNDLEIVQKWLSIVTGIPIPAVVDSCAIAGVIDLLRTQGCFGLSARYAVCFGLSTSCMDENVQEFPSYQQFETIGMVFEEVLTKLLFNKISDLPTIGDSADLRNEFANKVVTQLGESLELIQPLTNWNYIIMADDEEGANLHAFCTATIDAFFDNDLLFSTKLFLKNAKGSFGLCVTSTLDSHRQICLAARGQTMSIGFFPDKKLICYGSEQAAVKAGMNATFPGSAVGEDVSLRHSISRGDIDFDWTRLDLDDLGGEIIVLDWGKKKYKNPPVSKPNRHLVEHELMNKSVHAILHQESKSTTLDRNLYHRMTNLSLNEMVKPLQEASADPVLTDIQDIPRICRTIQDDWHSNKAATSLNRLTAFNLSICLRSRLEAHVKRSVPSNAVDILLTGCEVSLWLAEQFASDLQKSFPKLCVQAVSSNKLLGLYGQEIAVPALGFPYSSKTRSLNDCIVIIVSHSGGTFAPLACSNLLQSATKNIFVVTSEWDTQIGKQLRAMNQLEDGEDSAAGLLNHRIFSTEVGMRPAEPCSISVVATHQLLTNLFEYISVVILSDPRFRRVTAATITDQDIQVLERCNQMNIDALTELVGINVLGYALDRVPTLMTSLHEAGDLWAEHILENAKAYIMTFIYIFVTVITGFPLATAIAFGAGLDMDSKWGYLIRTIDSAIYFWLPQINITLLRLWQGRNLLHRMVGRTVVIGDIPWVAQSAEAFLSKIFAVSYSIAGLNVLSGNPADHFVHRHTHRVVRGTLSIFGRPDGRLSALSTAETSVCLSVNQASSIQSRGGTCESITIGHNPFKLDLSLNGIFLKRFRPLFLCERMLVETDANHEKNARQRVITEEPDESDNASNRWRKSIIGFVSRRVSGIFSGKSKRQQQRHLNLSQSIFRAVDCSVSLKIHKNRSAPALLGAYLNIDENTARKAKQLLEINEDDITVDDVVTEVIVNRKWFNRLHKLYESMDVNRDGLLSLDEFIKGTHKLNPDVTEEEAVSLFQEGDTDGTGFLEYDEFVRVVQYSDFESSLKTPQSNRDERGIIQIDGTKEKYFGENMRKANSGKEQSKDMDFVLARSQHLCQELYETRIASMQRFVAMVVMFHHIGKRVQDFFSTISFGLWGYRMDRTHSIMRIATTASPVSGADVRQRMAHLRLLKKVQNSVEVISRAYLAYKKSKEEKRVNELVRKASGDTLLEEMPATG